VSKWMTREKNTERQQESQYWKISGYLESLKAGGEKVRSSWSSTSTGKFGVRSSWSSTSTGKFGSIVFVYVYIILIALFILLLSYYSTLIALICVKTCCLRIFNWYILVAHLIPLSLYVIWLFESFYNILIFNPFCFDSSKNKYKKIEDLFFISQTNYKIFLKIEWIINFSRK